MRLLPLLGVVALCGCASERAQLAPVGVLWRGTAPIEQVSVSAAPVVAPIPAAGPNPLIRYDLTMLTGTLQDFVQAGLVDPALPQTLVVADARIEVFLAAHPADSHVITLTGYAGSTCQTAFTTQYRFISDYHFDQHDVPVPVISTLNFGSLLSISGHVDQAGVVLDRFQGRSSELVSVTTEVGSYPAQGVLRQYPWEEPTLMCSDATLGAPLTLGAGSAVVVPCQYWSDRPSPSVHSRMPVVTTDAMQLSPAPRPPHWHQCVVCIRAHELPGGSKVNPSSPLVVPPLSAVDLTPPWHRTPVSQ